MPFAKDGTPPVYLEQLRALFRRHPRATIVWAHIGLGRIVHPIKQYAAFVEAMLDDPTLAHVSFDISWDEVAKYIVATPEGLQNAAGVLNRHPDRFLFGTDALSPATPEGYFKTYEAYQPLWAALTPEARAKVLKGNYERLFDAARVRVRAWEKANVK
jgi:predicted TIM-barrel fold metal-dependent hydrolase